MPQFLADEIQDFLKTLYGIQPDDRIFTVTKSYLHREMARGAKESGVKRIRVHDIRHSHVSLLIDMGFSATAIADRVGHESIDITYNYTCILVLAKQNQTNFAISFVENMNQFLFERKARFVGYGVQKCYVRVSDAKTETAKE